MSYNNLDLINLEKLKKVLDRESSSLEDYITFELGYHQNRYMESESRAAKLAGFCGTLAAILASGAFAIVTNFETFASLPQVVYIPFGASILMLFSASVTSLIGLIGTDKYGNLTKPRKVKKWIKHIEQASRNLESSNNKKSVIDSLKDDSPVILWVNRNQDESVVDLVLRSKIISLLAFKRSIGFRQNMAAYSIWLIILSLLLIMTTIGLVIIMR